MDVNVLPFGNVTVRVWLSPLSCSSESPLSRS